MPVGPKIYGAVVQSERNGDDMQTLRVVTLSKRRL